MFKKIILLFVFALSLQIANAQLFNIRVKVANSVATDSDGNYIDEGKGIKLKLIANTDTEKLFPAFDNNNQNWFFQGRKIEFVGCTPKRIVKATATTATVIVTPDSDGQISLKIGAGYFRDRRNRDNANIELNRASALSFDVVTRTMGVNDLSHYLK